MLGRHFPRLILTGALALSVTGCKAEATGAPPAVAESPATEVVLPVPQPQQAAPPAPPTSAPTCTNDAAFLEDLTLPDGTRVLPGASLDKRWLILNKGTCDWGPEYRLVQLGESRLGGPSEVALFPARAGGQAVVQVTLTAPSVEGEFISRWQARAPDGSLFGEEVFAVLVVDASTPTPSPIPTAPRP